MRKELSWVDHKCFVGVDRRRSQPNLRFWERRGTNIAGPPPALATALRQLRVRMLDGGKPENIHGFCARADAVATLADSVQQSAVAIVLVRLCHHLRTAADMRKDPSEIIQTELLKAESLLGSGRSR